MNNYSQYKAISEQTTEFRLVWDRFTARGFFWSACCMVLLLIWFSYTHIEVDPLAVNYNSQPIVLLNFGPGDGTGARKGNLRREGAMAKGKAPSNPLEDASRAAPLPVKKPDIKLADASQTNSLKPVKVLSSAEKTPSRDSSATGSKATGAPGGGSGSGLGQQGNGTGRGEGLGDIDWGGGGNRTVLNKVLPERPAFLNREVQLRIRFTVLPDGSVGEMRPVQKGDSELEKLSMGALRRWKFNRIAGSTEMTGVITFSFKMD